VTTVHPVPSVAVQRPGAALSSTEALDAYTLAAAVLEVARADTSFARADVALARIKVAQAGSDTEYKARKTLSLALWMQDNVTRCNERTAQTAFDAAAAAVNAAGPPGVPLSSADAVVGGGDR